MKILFNQEIIAWSGFQKKMRSWNKLKYFLYSNLKHFIMVDSNALNQKLTLSCEHYEHEFNKCQSSILGYFEGEKSSTDCEFYKNLFKDCLNQGDASARKALEKYEMNMLQKRAESIKNNDVWKYRNEPPSDWNSYLTWNLMIYCLKIAKRNFIINLFFN